MQFGFDPLFLKRGRGQGHVTPKV